MASSAADEWMPELKHLSRINGQINNMTKENLCDQLSKLNLDISGSKDVLKKRLKGYYKRQKFYRSPQSSVGTSRHYFDYLCIIDFEATCQLQNPPQFQQEIIEFPALLLCTHNRNVIEEFHRYCRPVINPTLTEFCTSLTGITQQQVDDAEPFPKVLEEFESWLAKFGIGKKHKFAVVTDGPWDMSRFLYQQCIFSGIPFPRFGKKWINVRKIFSNFFRCKRMSLLLMLEFLGMAFEGRQHCGLDDARNIARIVSQLLQDGAEFKVNEWLHVNSSTIQQVSAGTSTQDTPGTLHQSACCDPDGLVDEHSTEAVKSTRIQKSNCDKPQYLMSGNFRNRPPPRKNTSSKQGTISLEEQMENLGVDPSLENSWETIVAEKKLLQPGKR